jgi:uncharacterized alkaline shock family protein YloU
MTEEKTVLGSIHVSPRAVATVARHAAVQSYGVVGLASKNMFSELASSITNLPPRGVSVEYEDGRLRIDLYVVVEYSTRIASVANSVANAVRYQIEKTLGIPVDEINVHIVGMRVSNND